MRKAILWDNDGVLVDTERLFFQATAISSRRMVSSLRSAPFSIGFSSTIAAAGIFFASGATPTRRSPKFAKTATRVSARFSRDLHFTPAARMSA
jgi:beta-phosphoglucomutase-like phosphatase (HAD superfamily)